MVALAEVTTFLYLPPRGEGPRCAVGLPVTRLQWLDHRCLPGADV